MWCTSRNNIRARASSPEQEYNIYIECTSGRRGLRWRGGEERTKGERRERERERERRARTEQQRWVRGSGGLPAGSSSADRTETPAAMSIIGIVNKNEFIVGGKYRLMRKIGSGSFGDIYLGINVSNGEVSCSLMASLLFLLFCVIAAYIAFQQQNLIPACLCVCVCVRVGTTIFYHFHESASLIYTLFALPSRWRCFRELYYKYIRLSFFSFSRSAALLFFPTSARLRNASPRRKPV